MKFDEAVDQSGMRQEIELWPTQLERSFNAGFELGKSEDIAPPRALVWAGMGGSAIGGDFVASLASKVASFPVLVHRGGEFPAWIGKEDRVVLVSFSGNTAETLEAAREAKKRGASIDLLTSGGQIEKWGIEQGITVWKIPGGRPPRSALGDLFGFSFGVLSGRGWCKVTETELEEAVSVLKELNDSFGVSPANGNEALEMITGKMIDRFPMIYGTGNFASAARRWACQFNENSKFPAHWGELPEMNHNEVVAYIEDSKWADKGFVIILADPDSPDDILSRVDVTLNLAKASGWETLLVSPVSDTPLARLVEVTLTGDWLSYWLAIAQGVDPTPIGPIDTLKAALES